MLSRIFEIFNLEIIFLKIYGHKALIETKEDYKINVRLGLRDETRTTTCLLS